jgi:hypothetical protein
MPCFQGLLFQAVVVIVLKPVGLCGNFGFRQLQNHLQAETASPVFLRSTCKETANRPPLYSALSDSSAASFEPCQILQGGTQHVLNLFDPAMQKP